MKKIILVLVAFISLQTITSCSSFFPEKNNEQVMEHKFDNVALEYDCKTPKIQSSIQINEVLFASPYNTRKMYYSEKFNLLDSYYTHQWVTSPENMMTDDLVQNLQSKCIYSSVFRNNAMTVSDLRLKVNVTDFYLKKYNESYIFILNANSLLINNKNNSVLLNNNYEIKVSKLDNKFNSYIEGAQSAKSQLIKQLIDNIKVQ